MDSATPPISQDPEIGKDLAWRWCSQRLIDLEDISHKWDKIGTEHDLKSDSDIAGFLLKHYEDALEKSKTSQCCSICQAPLSLSCTRCSSILNQPASGDAEQEASPGNHQEMGSLEQAAESPEAGFTSGPPEKVSVPKLNFLTEELSVCTLCTSVFPSSESLTMHMQDHATEMPYKCEHCGVGFLESSVLALHLKQHLKKLAGGYGYTCQYCCSEFHTSVGLDSHQKVCKNMPVLERNAVKDVFPQDTTLNTPDFAPGCVKEANTDHQTTEAENADSPKTYKCSACNKQLPTLFLLKQHFLSHTGERSYACQVCGSTYTRKKNLLRHIRLKHTKKQPVSCGSCHKTFFSNKSLNSHVCEQGNETEDPIPAADVLPNLLTTNVDVFSQRHHAINLLTSQLNKLASLCQQSESGSSLLTQSVTGSTKESSFQPLETSSCHKPYKCPYCSSEFAFASVLTHHIQEHIGREFECSHCEATFREFSDLTKHLQKHKNVQCYVCKKSFASTTKLDSHVCLRCDVCQAVFKTKQRLTRHIRTHTGEKPCLCTLCGKAFAHRNLLKRHRVVHTRERPYTCQECNKSFSDKSGLNKHVTTHTEVRSHLCSVCGKAFKNLYYLNTHIRLHKNEKPYKCSECEVAFAMKSSLTDHMRTHTGEKPYECPYCGRRFAKSCNRAAHIRTHKHLSL